MKKIIVNDVEYELIKDYKNTFNEEEFISKYTEYFDDFDYILGDYSYSKLRLKGFCCKDNTHFNSINDYNDVDNYIKNYCSYNCGYYIVRKNDKKN